MGIRQIGLVGLFAFAALFALAAGAADVTGTWEANIDTKSGKVPTTFEIVADGENVKGTFSNSFVPPLPLEEGVLKGDDISFKVRLLQLVLGYRGVVKGDQMTLTSTIVEGARPPGFEEVTFTATKAKAKAK
jgi:hypothetical protein